MYSDEPSIGDIIPVMPIIAVVIGVLIFIFLLILLKYIIRIETPNKIMIVTGKNSKSSSGNKVGFSIFRGRTHVVPLINTYSTLSLEIIPINVKVESVNSANGISISADATACVCIDNSSLESLNTAVERLQGKTQSEIQEQIKQTLVGNFRGALNKSTPLQAIGMEDKDNSETSVKRSKFREDLLADINEDLKSFGMTVVSVSLQRIWDSSSYIDNLSQKKLAAKKQDVEVQEAYFSSIGDKAVSDSKRRCSVAQNNADTSIIKAKEELEVFRRECQGQIKQAQAQAKNRVSEALNNAEKEIQENHVELNALKNQSEVTIIAESKKVAAEIISEGQAERITIIEGAKNYVLEQKMKLLNENGSIANTVMFIQKNIEDMYQDYLNHSKDSAVDSLVVLDTDTGFKGAVNRGAVAFADFLDIFNQSTGVNIKEFMTANLDSTTKKEGNV